MSVRGKPPTSRIALEKIMENDKRGQKLLPLPQYSGYVPECNKSLLIKSSVIPSNLNVDSSPDNIFVIFLRI